MGACIIIVGCVFGSLVRQRGVLQSRLYSRQDDSITCLFFFYLARRSVGEVPEALPNFAMLFFFSALSRYGNPAGVPCHFVNYFKTGGKPNLTRCKRDSPGYLRMFIKGLLMVVGKLAGHFGET